MYNLSDALMYKYMSAAILAIQGLLGQLLLAVVIGESQLVFLSRAK